jgi:Flp pilus assembly protein TadD
LDKRIGANLALRLALAGRTRRSRDCRSRPLRPSDFDANVDLSAETLGERGL